MLKLIYQQSGSIFSRVAFSKILSTFFLVDQFYFFELSLNFIKTPLCLNSVPHREYFEGKKNAKMQFWALFEKSVGQKLSILLSARSLEYALAPKSH